MYLNITSTIPAASLKLSNYSAEFNALGFIPLFEKVCQKHAIVPLWIGLLSQPKPGVLSEQEWEVVEEIFLSYTCLPGVNLDPSNKRVLFTDASLVYMCDLKHSKKKQYPPRKEF